MKTTIKAGLVTSALLAATLLGTPAAQAQGFGPSFGMPFAPMAGPMFMPPPPVFMPPMGGPAFLPPPPVFMPPMSGPTFLPGPRPSNPFNLNPEQQIGAECLSTFGATKAGAACVGGRLTTREIGKCQNGIGTSNGCFGPNNDIVRHGRNVLNDITNGPGDGNEITGKNGFVRRTFGW